MLNELFATLSAAILSMMPASTAPDVNITTVNVEKSIQQFVESSSEDVFTVHCKNEGTITLINNETKTLECEVTNNTLLTTHTAEATLKASNGSIILTGLVNSAQLTPTPSATPDGMTKE